MVVKFNRSVPLTAPCFLGKALRERITIRAMRGSVSNEGHPDPMGGNGPCLTTKEWEQVAEAAGYEQARMAALCGLSQRHLQRVFKKELRCTPTQWLRELRCRRAQRLILQGYSSKAAAAELKYATNAHFCREFKKVFGVSPQCFAPGGVRFPWDA